MAKRKTLRKRQRKSQRRRSSEPIGYLVNEYVEGKSRYHYFQPRPESFKDWEQRIPVYPGEKVYLFLFGAYGDLPWMTWKSPEEVRAAFDRWRSEAEGIAGLLGEAPSPEREGFFQTPVVSKSRAGALRALARGRPESQSGYGTVVLRQGQMKAGDFVDIGPSGAAVVDRPGVYS